MQFIRTTVTSPPCRRKLCASCARFMFNPSECNPNSDRTGTCTALNPTVSEDRPGRHASPAFQAGARVDQVRNCDARIYIAALATDLT